jgi:SAM-dependent methyltransferase
MMDGEISDLSRRYWERAGLGERILDELRGGGKNVDHLTVADLAPYDHFHGGGMGMTLFLASAAELRPGMKILDVGGGLGGPARTLAVEFGCDVTVADLTESYIETGRLITEIMHLESKVRFIQADALDLPFENNSFDLVWTQNSGMNISDKSRLYQEFSRVLRPDGILALQEPMLGINQPMLFPVMWAENESTSFLRTPDEIKGVIESAGFTLHDWRDVSAELEIYRRKYGFSDRGIQVIVMGDRLPLISQVSKQNADEGRVVLMQGICWKQESCSPKN